MVWQEQCPRVMNLVGGFWRKYMGYIYIYMGYMWDICGIYGIYGIYNVWIYGWLVVWIMFGYHVSSIVMMIRSDFHSYFSVGGRST